MTSAYVVTALLAKRTELARQVKAADGALRKLRIALDHVDATIRLVAPDVKPEELPEVREGRAPPPVKDLHVLVLEVLRLSTAPLSSREIARRILDRLGLAASTLEPVDKSTNAYLRRQGGRHAERVGDTRPARWRLRD